MYNAMFFKKSFQNTFCVNTPFVYRKEYTALMLKEELTQILNLLIIGMSCNINADNPYVGYSTERIDRFRLNKKPLIKKY